MPRLFQTSRRKAAPTATQIHSLTFPGYHVRVDKHAPPAHSTPVPALECDPKRYRARPHRLPPGAKDAASRARPAPPLFGPDAATVRHGAAPRNTALSAVPTPAGSFL